MYVCPTNLADEPIGSHILNVYHRKSTKYETYVRIQRGILPPPLKKNTHKNIGFLSNTGPDPLKIQSYRASIQCRAIIGHLNGVSLADQWWSAYSGIWILPPLIIKKALSKWDPLWQNFLDPRMKYVHFCTGFILSTFPVVVIRKITANTVRRNNVYVYSINALASSLTFIRRCFNVWVCWDIETSQAVSAYEMNNGMS